MSYLEKEVLGCFLKDNSLLKETIIKKNFFSEESHQVIFETMQKLANENKAIDRVTLLAANYEYIQSIGGPNYILQLETTGEPENFDSYEKQLIDEYKQRESERITKEWLSKKKKDNQQLITELQQIDDIGHTEETDKNSVLMEMINEPYQEETQSGILTGLMALDRLTGGFQNAQSYIIGARPSMGKTAFMLKLAKSAIKHNAVPIIFSLEMAKRLLLKRMIAALGNINLFLTRNPNMLNESKKEKWKQAVNTLYQMDFEIYDKPMQTIQYIRSRLRKAEKKYEGKQIIVFIDYLTLIRIDGHFHSDHAKVSEISAQLKALAKEFDCPVITLAQLSRSVEQRQDKRPLLSDLRESGSIEQDADLIMFLYREGYYKREVDDTIMEVIVAKHRDGPTGTAKIFYNKATGIMGDLDETQGIV
mgnify:CR=1 FL=1